MRCSTSWLAPLLLLSMLPAALAGETRWVGPRPAWLASDESLHDGIHHPTLEAALAAANDGDRIIVPEGQHRGELRVRSSVQLLGYGRGELPELLSPLVVEADDVLVDRFVLSWSPGPVLEVRSAARVAITRCQARRCDVAIELLDSRDCRLEDNLLEWAGRSLLLVGGGGHLLRRNLVVEAGQYAVEIEHSSDVRLLDNIVRRPGWAGIVVHSGSTNTQIEGNWIDGGDVGLSIQTEGNLVRGNVVSGAGRGLVLGVSPRGADPEEHLHPAFLDSAHGDARVDASHNRVLDNRFDGCRSEGLLLRGATANLLAGNRVRGGDHGIVLLAGADDNTLQDNLIDEVGRAAVAEVDSHGNRLQAGLSVRRVRAEGAAPAGDASTSGSDGPASDALAGDLPSMGVGADVPLPRPAPLDEARLLLWGDLHTHSLLSDGCTSAEEVLSYGRDVAGLHFLSLSDHAEILSLEAGRWPGLRSLCAAATVPGRFLGVSGYEVTYPVFWDGHYNVYYAHAEGHLHRAPYDEYTGLAPMDSFTPARLLDALRADDDDALVVRHHFGPCPDYWRDSPYDLQLVPLTEITSVHGVFSGERDVDENRNHRGTETQPHNTSMAEGLERDWVFGLVGSSDSHYGFPGDRGLMAVAADAFDIDSLFEALRARRTYATTGARIRLGFRVDGAPMGSVLPLRDGAVTLEAEVEGTDTLRELVLMRDGEVLAHGDLDGRHGRLAFVDARPPRPGTRYRVRAVQVDGEAAWSSPVWFDPPAPRRADEQALADRERMSLMVYAASVRAWHKLGLGVLDGLTPSEAADDPAMRGRLLALWPRWLETAEAINALGDELGLVDRAQAKRIVDQWSWRWGNQLPSTITSVEPMIDTAHMARILGIDTP